MPADSARFKIALLSLPLEQKSESSLNAISCPNSMNTARIVSNSDSHVSMEISMSCGNYISEVPTNMSFIGVSMNIEYAPSPE